MRRWICGLSALAALTLLPAAEAATTLVSLYKGEPARQTGITLGGWGSGTVKETTEEALQGGNSLLVTTQGSYSGARLDFARPVDMSRYGAMKGVALSISLKAVGAGSGDSFGGYAPGGGYLQMPMPGGPPVGPGVYPVPGGLPVPGAPGYNPNAPYGAERTKLPASRHFRVVLFSGETQVVASHQPLDVANEANGWVPVVIPLAAFRSSGGAPAKWEGFRLSRLLLFGETTDTFYVGNIILEQYEPTITRVSAGDDKEAYAGDTVEFKAEANGAGLRYTWDFDDRDGIQEDAIGSTATYRYRKAGTYTVTLTVSDPHGVMPPVTDKITVTVNG